MPSTLDNALNLLKSRVDQLFTKNIDLTGRRVINASNSVNAQDYVTRAELNVIQDEVTALKVKLGIN